MFAPRIWAPGTPDAANIRGTLPPAALAAHSKLCGVPGIKQLLHWPPYLTETHMKAFSSAKDLPVHGDYRVIHRCCTDQNIQSDLMFSSTALTTFLR